MKRIRGVAIRLVTVGSILASPVAASEQEAALGATMTDSTSVRPGVTGRDAIAKFAAASQTQTPPAKTTEMPRGPDGKPNFQGYWRRTVHTASLEDFPGDVFITPQKTLIVDPPDGRLPYRADARGLSEEISQKYHDPNTLCFLLGVPRVMYQSPYYQFLQTPAYMVFIAEEAHAYRVIPMDGRPHIGSNIKQWQGDSRGHWDGDTLVIDVTNHNDKTRFDTYTGNFASDALHVVERYTPVDADTIRYEVTVEDPNVYTRPWKMVTRFVRHKEENFQIIEEACYEGERDVQHMRQFSVYPGLEALKNKPR